MNAARPPQLGVVVIGRNEGERLRVCLQSVVRSDRPVVYVDSGSSDGSIDLARSMGATVVALDSQIPFTAALARNAGWRRLVELNPATNLIQFVDGDCEVIAGWWDHALNTMSDRNIGVCCGRRRERFPDASIFNLLCDLEWDTPVGDAEACGGDAMFRLAAIQEVGGFRDSMIAGEEPELCLRLRRRGFRIVRIDADMTWHDVAMTRFSQWWRRAVRAGHAYAEGAWVSRGEQPRLWQKELRSIVFWGIALPVLALGATWWTHGFSLVLLLAYTILFARVWLRVRCQWPGKPARIFATFCVIAKWAHALGMLRFWSRKMLGRRQRLIEYKKVGPVTSTAS